MTTRDDVLDAIHRLERAGCAGEATRAAQAALTLPLPPQGFDRVLERLRAAHPNILGRPEPPAGRAAVVPPVLGAGEQGRAAQAMKDAEAALAHQLSTSAEFDRQVIEALLHTHATTVEGRRRLDDLESEIVSVARSWDLTTAVGAREFQRFLIAKLGQIARVVEDTDDDDGSKRALAAALTALYAAQPGRDEPAATAPAAATAADGIDGAAVDSAFEPDAYLPAVDDPQPDYPGSPRLGAPAFPETPSLPGFGGEAPGLGGLPGAGMAGGLPLAGLLAGLRRGAPSDGTAELDATDPTATEDVSTIDGQDGERDEQAGDDAPAEADATPDGGPILVRLPDGATTAVADPQLAAAMQAVADGTPVAEAFRRQGIAIPPPGTPVAAPVGLDRLRPGDVGVFTDRHALAVGDNRALLDGQIHDVANVAGPGFLGWHHPPVGTAGPDPVGSPAPTRPAMLLQA